MHEEYTESSDPDILTLEYPAAVTKEKMCFIIYARLGSERLPRKMLKPFAGTTLMDIALSKIPLCETIPHKDFYLCVHEPELVELGHRRGFQVFERSEESMREDSRLPVLMEWWDKLPYDYCVAINPCHAHLTPSTIDDFVRTYRASDHEGLFTVTSKKSYFWNKDGLLITPWPKGQDLMNSKAVEPTLCAVGCMWAGKLSTIGNGKWMGSFQEENDPPLYIVPEEESLDIDFEWEFNLSAAYWNSGSLPHTSEGDLVIAPD